MPDIESSFNGKKLSRIWLAYTRMAIEIKRPKRKWNLLIKTRSCTTRTKMEPAYQDARLIQNDYAIKPKVHQNKFKMLRNFQR